ncbi:MAG: class B sortase [Oscillospiraceae bacterium]|nr:class B sortase [Oscillospiraceae bacterium]
MDNNRRPESDDALEALEAVVNMPPKRRKKNFFEKNMIPLKGDSARIKRRKVIFDSCLLVMFVCLLVLSWVVVIDPWNSKRLFGELEDLYNQGTEISEPYTEATKPDDGSPAIPPTTTSIIVTRPLTHPELLERNRDYKGWLRAPGADISLPIVQTADNSYYLKRDFYRRPSKYGNPFVDCRVDMKNPTNIIIYGHHMSNGTIFTYLTRYKNAGTVKNSPLITLELPDGTVNRYKIVSVLAINGRSEDDKSRGPDDNGYVFAVNTPEFGSQASFDGYVRQIKQRSYVDTGVDVRYGDQLISLQTCIYDFDYEFLYVIGRLVREGESTSVPNVKANPSPRHPQALYDKLKQTNPYADAERWYPS